MNYCAKHRGQFCCQSKNIESDRKCIGHEVNPFSIAICGKAVHSDGYIYCRSKVAQESCVDFVNYSDVSEFGGV